MSTNDSEWRAGEQHYLSALDFINTKSGAGEAATHNIKLTERGEKKRKTDIYIVISKGAVYKGAIFNFSLPTGDVIRLRIWAE